MSAAINPPTWHMGICWPPMVNSAVAAFVAACNINDLRINGNMVAPGNTATASGVDTKSVALGRYTLASAAGALAIGGGDDTPTNGAQATAAGATAIGGTGSAIPAAVASAAGSIAVGGSDGVAGSTSANATAAAGIAIGAGYNGTAGAISSNVAAIAVGLKTTASGANAIAIGNGATAANDDNIAIGLSTSPGPNSIAIGKESQMVVNANKEFNTSVGHNSLQALSTGDCNSAFGHGALNAETTGSNNVAVGRSALLQQFGVSENTAVGALCASSITTGTGHSIFGYNAGVLTTTTNNCTYIGHLCGDSTDGDNNTAIGKSALRGNYGAPPTNAADCTAVGYMSLNNVEGDDNTAIGSNSGLLISSGFENTIIGSNAGDTLTTGDNNTLIGYNAQCEAAHIDTVVIGANSSSLAGSNVIVGTGSNEGNVANTPFTVLGNGISPAVATVPNVICLGNVDGVSVQPFSDPTIAADGNFLWIGNGITEETNANEIQGYLHVQIQGNHRLIPLYDRAQ